MSVGDVVKALLFFKADLYPPMTKNYLYHKVPPDFVGPILYPLNRLKQRLPDVYARQVKKYQGREAVLKRRIPHLNCLWNDVLHFSPVHPTQCRAALQAAGFN